jgi:flagellar motor switch protein FliN/FliY
MFPGPDGVDPLASLNLGGGDPVHPVRFPPLGPSDNGGGTRPIDLIMDVSMRVSVELGRSTLTVEEVLELGPGSVVELNKLAGEPVDILVNERLIARGEVVVVDENFGVRITEIISPRQRVNAMGR